MNINRREFKDERVLDVVPVKIYYKNDYADSQEGYMERKSTFGRSRFYPGGIWEEDKPPIEEHVAVVRLEELVKTWNNHMNNACGGKPFIVKLYSPSEIHYADTSVHITRYRET